MISETADHIGFATATERLWRSLGDNCGCRRCICDQFSCDHTTLIDRQTTHRDLKMRLRRTAVPSASRIASI